MMNHQTDTPIFRADLFGDRSPYRIWSQLAFIGVTGAVATWWHSTYLTMAQNMGVIHTIWSGGDTSAEGVLVNGMQLLGYSLVAFVAIAYTFARVADDVYGIDIREFVGTALRTLCLVAVQGLLLLTCSHTLMLWVYLQLAIVGSFGIAYTIGRACLARWRVGAGSGAGFGARV